MNNILIIGTGPVGLYTGYLLCKKINKNNNFEIIFWKARKKFTREQILLLQNDIISKDYLLNKQNLINLNSSCYLKKPISSVGYCYLNNNNTDNLIGVRTKELEQYLYDYLKKIKYVKFINKSKYEELDNIEQYNCIYICDGVNSPIGKTLLNSINKKPSSNKYCKLDKKLDKKYYGLGIFYNREINHKNIKQNFNQNRYRGFISNKTPYYFGVQISKQLFDKIPQLEKNKTLYETLIDLNNNDKLDIIIIIKTLLFYYNIPIKKDTEIQDNNIIPDFIKNISNMFKFEINLKYKTPITKIINNTPVFMIGDNSFNAHFFSGEGVNSGLRCSKQLIDLFNISKDYIGYNKNIITEYNKIVNNELCIRWSKYNNILIDFNELNNIIRLPIIKNMSLLELINNIPNKILNKNPILYKLKKDKTIYDFNITIKNKLSDKHKIEL